MDRQTQRLQVELEENSWRAFAVLQYTGVVRDAILICVNRLCARSNVCRWHDVYEILVRDKCWRHY
jgi:hypothetical protein